MQGNTPRTPRVTQAAAWAVHGIEDEQDAASRRLGLLLQLCNHLVGKSVAILNALAQRHTCKSRAGSTSAHQA
jgi:hypothetical protein